LGAKPWIKNDMIFEELPITSAKVSNLHDEWPTISGKVTAIHDDIPAIAGKVNVIYDELPAIRDALDRLAVRFISTVGFYLRTD
jgi:hypothetical protein